MDIFNRLNRWAYSLTLFKPIAVLICFSMVTAVSAQVEERALLFEQLMDAESFQDGLGEVWPDIQKKLDRPHLGPPVARGALITEVDPTGQAPGIGLSVGDVIVSIEGVDVLTRFVAYRYLRAGKESVRLNWIDPQGDFHEGEVKAGRIGVTSEELHDMLAWYAQSELRDDAWDRELLLALHMLDRYGAMASAKDLDLTETALHRAAEAGFPDEMFLRSLAAELAIARMDFPRAWEQIKRLPFSDAQNRHLMMPARRLHVALAMHEMTYAAKLFEMHGPQVDGIDSDALQAWLLSASQEPHGLSPADIAAQVEHIRINPQLEKDPIRFENRNDWLLEQLLAERPATSDIAPARYQVATLRSQDPLGDFEATLEMKLIPSRPASPVFPNTITVAVFDRNQLKRGVSLWDQENRLFGLQFEFQDDTPTKFWAGGFPFLKDRSLEIFEIDITGNTQHKFRLIRVGGRAQILIDDKTVLDTHVDPAAMDLTLMLHIVGVNYRDLTMTVDRLQVPIPDALN